MTGRPKVHPALTRFKPYVSLIPADEMPDPFGARFKNAWNRWPDHEPKACDPERFFRLSEELFEYIDLLESVEAAQRTYTFVELGAGWGRWGFRAARAALDRGLKARIVLAECEPQHVQWLHEAAALNAHPDLAVEIADTAIAYGVETVPLHVKFTGHDAASWYGQSVVHEHTRDTEETYFGRPVRVSDASGFGYIDVPAKPLEAILGHLDFIDIIDMDLQGLERQVVEHSMDFLDQRVRRVHIGTHGADIDDQIRAAFGAQGWRKVWDFGCHRENRTPYGTCSFVDGVSSWINPKL